MPCRPPGGEGFLLLEHAVSLQSGPVGASSGSKEVDALVAKLGEVLQLSAQHRTPPAPRLLPKHHGRDRAAPYSSPRGLGFLASLHHRHPPPHQRSAASLLLLPPPPPPTTDQKGSPRVAKQLCGRGWLRSAARSGGKKHHHHSLLSAGDDDEEDDDPHRLLQELILSGNLIKEAVRRLQLAATAAAASSTAVVETSTTGSPGSGSSTGSYCHSSSGEGDSAAATAFAVSSLQPLP
ncbi:GSK-3-binding protein-like [Rhineura floridana]|uniref:GSK-3-binding protein-like n=1 Tax=Rhineura floridana TaxID=261503 RepID=UPI002AC820A6|nr:GSK-3-binding protein-like [Rhineura floridana]